MQKYKLNVPNISFKSLGNEGTSTMIQSIQGRIQRTHMCRHRKTEMHLQIDVANIHMAVIMHFMGQILLAFL